MKKRSNKPITFEERKQIEKLLANGFNYSEIANKIGRSKTGVITDVKKIGKQNYTAKLSQERADKEKKEKYERLTKANKGIVFHPINLKLRVESLEMQMEILHDTIRELMNK